MIEIRMANEEDIKKIMPLQYALFKKEHSKEPINAINEHWFFTIDHKSNLIYLTENPNNRIFIAADNGNIVGYLAVQIKHRQPFMEKVADISEFYIEPSYKIKEIEVQLYKKSIEWVKEKGVKWITASIHYADNVTINFWKKKGFNEFERMFIMRLQD